VHLAARDHDLFESFPLSSLREAETSQKMLTVVLVGAAVSGFSQSWALQQLNHRGAVSSIPAIMSAASSSRRAMIEGAAALLLFGGAPLAAEASGGATAGKYTTIPIAKRRYYGRVKQGVFEYLAVGAAVKKGELSSATIDDFFADTILVSTARQKRTCNGNDDACTTKEKYSSRWEDMKLSMFLLGNAFRTDSGKPPEKVKQVKEAKAFFGQVDKLQKARMKGDRKGTALAYAASIEALEAFLNDVDLPPTFAPDYKEAADQEVPSLCQGSFCI